MPLRKAFTPLSLLLALYLLALAVLGGYLFWPDTGNKPLKVTRASLSPAGDQVLLEGKGFSDATQVSMSLDLGNRRFLRHTIPTYGRGGDMVRLGRYAYVLVQKKGLLVLDLAQPLRPRVLSTLALPGLARTLVVDDGVAYIACDRDGLALVDVSDPHSPRLLATLSALKWIQGLAIRSGRLYAAVYASRSEAGLAVVDVADPRRPKLLGRVSLSGQPLRVALWGDHVLVAAGKAGLLCLKLGPGLPQLRSQLPLPGIAHGLVLVDSHAFVANSLGGLSVVEMSEGSPRHLTYLQLPGNPTRLVVEGDRLYLSSMAKGCQMVNIENPAQPRLLGTFMQHSGAKAVAAAGKIVYLNSSKQGVQVLDLDDENSLWHHEPMLSEESVASMAREGALLALVTNQGILHLGEWRDGRPLRLLSSLSVPSKVDALAIHSGYVYLWQPGRGVTVVDARNPHLPVVVALDPVSAGNSRPEPIKHIPGMFSLAGSRGALLDNSGALWLFDTDQPERLRLKSDPDLQEPLGHIAWGKELLFAVSIDSPAVRAIDPQPDSAARIYSAFSLPAKVVNGLGVLGRVAVMACGLEGMLTVDFSNPDTPQLLAILPLPINVARLHLEGTRAFFADVRGALVEVDLSDPAKPRLEGLRTDLGALTDFVVTGQHALVASRSSGAEVVPLPKKLSPLERSFRQMTFVLPQTEQKGHYSLHITDGEQSVVLPGALVLTPR